MAMIIQKVFICVCVCVCKTRIFSVKLNACRCVSMSKLKGEDRFVLTYKCMCLYVVHSISFQTFLYRH